MPSVLFVMSDYGHDPTETAIPYREFKRENYSITFVTCNGSVPRCDAKMLTGITQKLLGATSEACAAYDSMMAAEEIKRPKKWSDDDFKFTDYDILFFPGGHEKSVRQVIESDRVQSLLLDFWPSIGSDVRPKKAIAAICHGVLVVAATKKDGKSVLYDNVKTTTLPGMFESAAYHSTKLFLGDYYKTFGADADNCEEMVKRELKDESYFQSSLSPGPFAVQDDKLNYLSGRYPADAALLAQNTIALFT